MDEPKRYDMMLEPLKKRCDCRMTAHEDVEGRWADTNDPAYQRMVANNAALAKAGLLDENGNLRKIIGTLPVTADGCAIGLGGNCYVLYEGDVLECGPIGIFDEDDGCGVIITLRDVSGFEYEWEPQQMFSTREAAEAAAQAAGGKDGQ